jgi:hypothetical protein
MLEKVVRAAVKTRQGARGPRVLCNFRFGGNIGGFGPAIRKDDHTDQADMNLTKNVNFQNS